MRHHVERVVKGRDRGNGADRFTFGEDLATFAMWRQIT